MTKEEIKAVIKDLFKSKDIVIIARPYDKGIDPGVSIRVYMDNEVVAYETFEATDELPLLPNGSKFK